MDCDAGAKGYSPSILFADKSAPTEEPVPDSARTVGAVLTAKISGVPTGWRRGRNGLRRGGAKRYSPPTVLFADKSAPTELQYLTAHELWERS